MLQLFESQKILWGLAISLASGVIAVLRTQLGWWSVPLLPVFAGAFWLVLRGGVEVFIRRAHPSRVAEHLAGFVGGSPPATGTSIWVDPISRRIAVDEYRRYWSNLQTHVQTELRLARRQAVPSRSNVVQLVHLYASRWIEEEETATRGSNTLQLADPVHSSIGLPPEFAPLLEHRLLQRLNEVRQLAFAFSAFPGGTHTRLAHSLGVAHLARSATRAAIEQGVVYTQEGQRLSQLQPAEAESLVNLATVCGLVHDIGHPPLGHTLDRFFASRFREGSDIADKQFLSTSLNQLRGPIEAINGVKLEMVLQVFSETRDELSGWGHFISALINSELDVDRLDYLQRDAHFTGQQEGLLNTTRLLQGVRPYEIDSKVFLTFDVSVLPDIEQFVYAREVMYLRCYERDEKVVAEWLILRAINYLFETHPELEDELEYVRLLTDHQLVQLVEESDSPRAIELFRRVYRSDARNYIPIAAVPFEAAELDSYLLGLHRDFTRRNPTLLEKVEGFVKDIATRAGVNASDVLLVLPDVRLADDRKMGLDIWLMQSAGERYEVTRLLSDKTDASASELLRRRKYVPVQQILTATDLSQLQETAAQTGLSFLHLLRRPRNRLRLYLHRRAVHAADGARRSLIEMGVKGTLEQA